MVKLYDTYVVKKVVQGGGGNIPAGAAVLTDSLAVEIIVADSNAAPTDSFTFDIDTTLTDTNAALADALTIGIGLLADSNPTPSEALQSLLTRWVTATATSGTTAPTNPANAQGQNNGTVATCKVGGLTAGTSVLTCTIATPMPEIAPGSTRTLVAYYAFNAGVGDSCSAVVSYRQVGQGSNTTVNLPATGNFLTTPATASLTNIDPSQPITITYTHSATVPATGGSVTVDATGIQTSGVI